jgi:hypothetical protein
VLETFNAIDLALILVLLKVVVESIGKFVVTGVLLG